jgi:hypothetical protein
MGAGERQSGCVTMSSRTCFGISKVANLLKSLDSESILKQVQHRIQNDKIGISFITTQPEYRLPAGKARVPTGGRWAWASPMKARSTLIGQIENKENFTQMMMKYYTRIIHREIKKGLYNDVFIYLLYVSL